MGRYCIMFVSHLIPIFNVVGIAFNKETQLEVLDLSISVRGWRE
jgi:hypothetical protein